MSEQNGDKRSVATDALETLGTIIDGWQKRDAIHLAVEPIEAGERLAPGEDVGIRDGKVYNSGLPGWLGIVDPFLKLAVQPGERFWLVVYPRQIHSLRHVWTHPKFPDATELADLKPYAFIDPVAMSREWIAKYCAEIGCRVDEMMSHAVDWVAGYGNYWIDGGRWEGESLREEFWTHFEVVTGKPVPENKRENFFSCSC